MAPAQSYIQLMSRLRSRPATTSISRNGTIVDGLGGEPFVGDVAVSDGVIAAVGTVDGTATGRSTRPGCSSRRASSTCTPTTTGRPSGPTGMTPSSAHGVTTAVMGNCGVGFAPCRAERPRGARRRDGRRGGHPRRRDGRRAAVDVGDLPGVPRRPGSRAARYRCGGVPAAFAAAGVRDGPARRRPRTRHRRRPGADAQAGRRGHRRRRAWLRVVAADDPQDRKRPSDPELRRRPRRDRGHRTRRARTQAAG